MKSPPLEKGAVSEVVPSLCKGGLGRVDRVKSRIYPLELPLTKGENDFGNSFKKGGGSG